MNKDFDLEDYLNQLEYLVNIDSGSRNLDGVKKIADFFKDKYYELGYKVQKYDFKEVGPCLKIKNNKSKKFDVLLLGHMDTVFPRGTTTERPFKIVKNKAYGPGVIDMKSGLLSMYYVLKNIKENHSQADINICAILNSDEEIGSKKSRSLIEETAKKSKAAYVLEPARENGALVLERKGIAGYNIEFTGKASHAGIEPQKGINANVELGRWILELDKQTNYKKGTTVNVGIVEGGSATNVVPEKASAKVNLRFKNNSVVKKFEKKINNLKNNPKVEGIKVEINYRGMRPAMNPNSETYQIWNKIEHIGNDLGIEMKWVATGGGSDANITAALGVPSIDGLGPVGGGAHSINEYLNISSIYPRYKLLKELVISS